jgi:hypothetical protein
MVIYTTMVIGRGIGLLLTVAMFAYDNVSSNIYTKDVDVTQRF